MISLILTFTASNSTSIAFVTSFLIFAYSPSMTFYQSDCFSLCRMRKASIG